MTELSDLLFDQAADLNAAMVGGIEVGKKLGAELADLRIKELTERYALMFAAVLASEREYDEESTPSDTSCPDCTLGCIPIAKPRTCAHHLRVAAIAYAEKT
jgi:hypothetical protein